VFLPASARRERASSGMVAVKVDIWDTLPMMGSIHICPRRVDEQMLAGTIRL